MRVAVADVLEKACRLGLGGEDANREVELAAGGSTPKGSGAVPARQPGGGDVIQ